MSVVKIGTFDAAQLTLQDAIKLMLDKKMGQLHAPLSQHTHLHIVLVHDADESAKLSVKIDEAVEASIAKHNARVLAGKSDDAKEIH